MLSTVASDLVCGSTIDAFSKIISVSTLQGAISVVEKPADICWTVGVESRGATVEKAIALERREGMVGERGGY